MLRIDEGDNGREVSVAAGQWLEICLEENRTTGFRWLVTAAGGPACIPADDHFEPPGGPAGGSGRHCWRFRAAAPGRGTITLVYRRTWEGAPEARTFNVSVRVGAPTTPAMPADG